MSQRRLIARPGTARGAQARIAAHFRSNALKSWPTTEYLIKGRGLGGRESTALLEL